VNEIILVIMKVLPIILILLLGVWMKKIGFVSADTVRGMKKITLSIALPCILFLTFFKAEMKPELLILSVVIFAACLLEFAMGFLIKKLQKSSNQFYPSLFTTFLTGPIGYPIFMAYFGAGNLTPERIQFLKSISNVEPKGILNASVNFSEMRMEEKGELDHYIGVATSYEIKEPYAVLNVASGTSNPEYQSEIWIPVRKIKYEYLVI